MTRLNRVLEVMAKEQVDCVIIKDETTIRYVTGFSGDSSLFYLDRYKGILITDGRYTEQAKHEMKMFQVLEYTGRIWACAAELAKDAKVVGFDGACFTYSDYVGLKELLSKETYMQSVDFSGIRQIKDNKELEMMVHAARIADEAFFKILDDIKPGRTERSLAGRLEYYMRALGSEKVSFDTIVASGVRSALPHGMASDKVIEVGDFITFDFGAVYKGYHSDMTRTVVLGMAMDWHKEIYSVVQEAQYKGMKAARTGMTGRELDAIVRDSIAACGYGDYFVHGLGHGVGLEIHELPNINKRGNAKLETGMIFTIEPGIYIPGKGGVRIEDTVVLTEDGAKALNGVKKQLIEIV
jgi:Xaa-Pro aminopeptidase